MMNLRPFQIGLLVGFFVIAMISLIFISNFSPSSSGESVSYGTEVTVWGTLPYAAINDVFDSIADLDEDFDVVQYRSFNEADFSNTLLNAIAEGRSPDLIIMPHTELVTQRSKLLPVPYDTANYSQHDVRSVFVDGAEIFALHDGLYAIPLAIDPLVLYWNRDLFAAAGLATPPSTWEEIVASTVSQLTRRDFSRNILQSALAFGEYRNVQHATAIITLLTLQSGSALVIDGERGYEIGLNRSLANGRPPLEAAVQFYTDFANAANPLYSWNRSQAEDKLSFIAGDLALYFGFGSEAQSLQNQNPNLNFDVVPVPQGSGASVSRTYGAVYGLAIPRASNNVSGAFAAARTITSPQYGAQIAANLRMAPATRSGISAGGTSTFEEVVFQSALIARGWLSPAPEVVESAFQTMIEDINSNRQKVSGAVDDAVDRLELAY